MPALAAADPVRATRAWAAIYREFGYNPLPSDDRPASEGGRKKPLIRFADLWETPAPNDLFDRFRTRNVQLMTGRFWGLSVLDLDGPEAVAEASRWGLPRTWTVWHSHRGRDSRHMWFRLPPGLAPRGKRTVWSVWDDAANGWKKHCAAELLVDRSLIVAPPSVHPKTGNTYGFEVGPRQMARPALIPAGLLRLPAVEPPPHARPVAPPAPPPPPPAAHRGRRGASLRHVLDNLTDKAGVARSLWGVRFAADATPSGGWVSCFHPFREDRNPSARFHLGTGALWTPDGGIVPFCKIAVALGLYADWREVVDDLDARFPIR